MTEPEIVTMQVNRALDRTFREYEFAVRPDTTDQTVLTEIWADHAYHVGPMDIATDIGVVLDIGANIGAFAILAHAIGAARVIAVEPEPSNLEALRGNVERNGLASVIEIIGGAVGDPDLPPLLSTFALGGGGAFTDRILREPEMDVIAIDAWEGSIMGLVAPDQAQVDVYGFDYLVELAGGEVDLVKIDVEGAEYEIIESASVEALAACHKIVMEYHGHRGSEECYPGRWGLMLAKLAPLFRLEISGPQAMLRATRFD